MNKERGSVIKSYHSDKKQGKELHIVSGVASQQVPAGNGTTWLRETEMFQVGVIPNRASQYRLQVQVVSAFLFKEEAASCQLWA